MGEVRLDRVLRMLSGVNALLVRVRDRKELLSEICRLSVSVGGYAASVVYYKAPGASTPQVFGCTDASDAAVMPSLQASMRQARLCSLVALPLLVDKTALGVLVLAARDPVTLSKEELQMLREVSGNVSFAMHICKRTRPCTFCRTLIRRRDWRSVPCSARGCRDSLRHRQDRVRGTRSA